DALAEQGQQLFLEMACADCHTVRGTAAAGTLGPDLTHLMSRHTLAAATLANTRGNLAGWIVDPQHAKPGNLMPQTDLSGEQLLALLAYLESLR
ncbi:MAG: c-type cytochrome, partial [Chloroflexi bacterium]|nr:c-type cytochrome [Chloroflexota bacterium]